MKKHATCKDTVFLPELTIFTAAISCIISIVATVTNIIILIAIYRNRNFFKRRSSFYGLLSNIVLADLMTGIFACNLSVYFHIKETLRKVVYFLLFLLYCTVDSQQCDNMNLYYFSNLLESFKFTNFVNTFRVKPTNKILKQTKQMLISA